ncbi:MAG: hypothetical protein II147_06635 [Lachnospiraceae bacterium]|nr:hypothetical protein [Lachnospiraceae bacterium]
MEGIVLTKKKLFFDTDCISAFLWVDESSIVTKLYGDCIAIPRQVYNELSAGRGQATVLKTRIDKMLECKAAILVDMELESAEYGLYFELVTTPSAAGRYIGKGEAACIALAKECNGILASNNLKDTEEYIKKFNLEYTTTADILVEAYNKRIITVEEAERIWAEMLLRRRKLGADTFKSYLEAHLM